MRYQIFFIAAASMALCVSCRTVDQNPSESEKDIIGFHVSGAVLSRSGESCDCLTGDFLASVPLTRDGADGLNMTAFIGDMPEWPVTRGTVVTTENISSAYGCFNTTVYMDGEIYKDVEKDVNIQSNSVSYNSDTDMWELDGGPYYWPDDESHPLTFCSYAPVGCAGLSAVNWHDGESLSFSYSLPAPSDGTSGYKDAENQKDLLFAIDPGQTKETCIREEGSYANINFTHALTAVRFIRGNIGDCTVSYVRMVDFLSSGTAEAEDDTDGKLVYTWSDQSGKKSFRQDFNADISGVAEGGALDPTSDADYTFMMIPQVLESTARIVIGINSGSASEREISFNIGSITDAEVGEGNAARLKDWSGYAGKVITFKGTVIPLLRSL